ncbi:MAG: SAM-dependent methyltransferase [Paludibacteraceae bacterium]|nr:SAM-dependent methyltransferase [Paludibacteraceae bacterium]
MASIYLIPNTLGECDLNTVLPQAHFQLIASIRYFIVEDVRTARRFLKKVDRQIDIDSLTFYTLNRHTDLTQIAHYLTPIEQGQDVGIISEAGCPAVADPGAEIVRIAQQRGFDVIPLVGPSSVLLALMGSGFNGQNFAFNGYLPIEQAERQKRIRQLEQRALQEHQSQIFIETPYRNMQLFADLLQTCRQQTMLCVACDLTLQTQYLRTLTVGQWKHQQTLPDLNKRPTVFVIY